MYVCHRTEIRRILSVYVLCRPLHVARPMARLGKRFDGLLRGSRGSMSVRRDLFGSNSALACDVDGRQTDAVLQRYLGKCPWARHPPGAATRALPPPRPRRLRIIAVVRTRVRSFSTRLALWHFQGGLRLAARWEPFSRHGHASLAAVDTAAYNACCI